MQDYITEAPRQTPVMARAQVLVVGGGSAGYSAAITAARQGADVLLLERCSYLGGMSTGGLVIKRDYAGPECPYGATGGLAHEVWDRIERAGGGYRPSKGKEGSEDPRDIHYGKLFAPKAFDHAPDTMVLDPEIVKLEAETMVNESGAQIIYCVQVVDTIVEDNRAAGVIIEGKEGRRAILADIIIDASGDGDAFAHAGAVFDLGTLEASVNFRIGGVNWNAILEEWGRDPDAYQKKWERERKRFNCRHGFWTLGLRPGIAHANMNTDEHVDILDSRALSAAAIEMRAKDRAMLAFLRENVRGFEDAYIIDTAPMIGCRTSRRLRGAAVVDQDEIYRLRSYDDSIMLAACFFRQDPACYTPERPRHAVAEIPYGALIPETLDGLLAAGRCISATYDAIHWIRDIPFAMASGQAAGIAAALASAESRHPRDVDVGQIQSRLSDLGAPYQRYASASGFEPKDQHVAASQ